MENLQQGKYYHVYNRGNNRENLFREADNYEHFLRLYDKYICPVAETFAWCLMPNHFHLLIHVKEEMVYKYSNSDRLFDPVRFEECKWETIQASEANQSVSAGPDCVGDKLNTNQKNPIPHLHFSHLFNAYTKYINKRYNRTGNLFQRPFKRKEICSADHFHRLVIYIHTNPEHHGFTDYFKDYPWTSYGTIISAKPTKLERSEVLGWFDDKANFIEIHKRKMEIELIKELMIE
jgi:putative transposase